MLTPLKHTKLLTILLFLSGTILAQTTLDSLMYEHRIHLDAYNRDKSSMSERTWIKLVELGNEADTVINIDKILIGRFLSDELQKNHELTAEVEKLKLEMSAVNKESEAKQRIIDGQQFLNKSLLIASIASVTLLIILLVLFISRNKKAQFYKRELEYLWSKKDETPAQNQHAEQIEKLQGQLDRVIKENNKMKDHLLKTKSTEKELREKLKKEHESNAKIEKEIKSLIERLHQKV